jgi:hypothetical protein
MKIPRLKGIWFVLPAAWATLLRPYIPPEPGWIAAYFAGVAAFAGWMVWSFITDDPIPPEVATERRLEISRKKTAELEKDLGYEPLNLHELDEIIKPKKEEA